uniref:Shisa family member 4 n=1 Tax=Varanus komodoensis TaxID=61221 RepID=A0A8D2LLW7_VARKO
MGNGNLENPGASGVAPWPEVFLQSFTVLADEDCKWYMDKDGSWHPGFDCNFPSFCCGDCYHRYCCFDFQKFLTERQQKHCMAFGPRTIAGIASGVILFVAIVATIVCCFLCSCCYLYQRRHPYSRECIRILKCSLYYVEHLPQPGWLGVEVQDIWRVSARLGGLGQPLL